MKHTVTFDLSVSQIEKAIKELEAYKSRCALAAEIFAARLVELGMQRAETAIESAAADPNASKAHMITWERVERDLDHIVFKIILSGSDILFIEFGAGVHYNDGALHSSIHPQGAELGYTIGDYGMGQGANEDGWSYQAGDRRVHTLGQRAACAIPAAMATMRENLISAAQEAWKQVGG